MNESLWTNNDLNSVCFHKRFPQLLRGIWFLQCIIPYFLQDFELSSSDPNPLEPQKVNMKLKFHWVHSPFQLIKTFLWATLHNQGLRSRIFKKLFREIHLHQLLLSSQACFFQIAPFALCKFQTSLRAITSINQMHKYKVSLPSQGNKKGWTV